MHTHSTIGLLCFSRCAPSLLVLLPAFLLLSAVEGAVAPYPVTMCNVINQARTAHAQHAKFAASYYAADYPNLNVTHQYIGVWETAGASTQRGVAQAFVLQATRCDLVIGPGATSLTQALNALIASPWIEFGATSMELSVRTNYPYFTRAIPHTGIATGNIGLVLQRLGWTTIGVLVAASSYGQSVQNAIVTSLGPAGKTSFNDVVRNDLSLADTTALLQKYIATSPTRVMVIGLTSTDALQATFLQAAAAVNLTDHFVVFFSEGMCSGGNSWALRGAFCISTAVDPVRASPFLQAYRTQRNAAAEVAAFVAMGFPSSRVDTTGTGSYQAVAADAARLGLRALGRYVARYGKLNATLAEFTGAKWLGAESFSDGLTGNVSLASGDRFGASFVISNAYPGAATLTAINVTADGNITLSPTLFMLGRVYANGDLPVVMPAPPPTPPAVSESAVIAFATVASVVVIAASLATLAALALPRYRLYRRLRGAPTDESRPFTMVFTDVESSTGLWAADPEAMSTALDVHNAVIRQSLEAHSGYEVKTIGDSFMCAFVEARDALQFAVAAQRGLFDAVYPEEIDHFYRQQMRDRGVPFPEQEYSTVFNGLRVRIGIHTGTGSVTFDAVQQIYDYYGTVVNSAARIEALGHGGQILASEETVHAAGIAMSGPVTAAPQVNGTVISKGAAALRGVPEPVGIFEVRETAFDCRVFPELRVAPKGDGEANAADVDSSTRSSGGSGGGRNDLMRAIAAACAGPGEVMAASLSKGGSSPRRAYTRGRSVTYIREQEASWAALLDPDRADVRERVSRIIASNVKRTDGPSDATDRGVASVQGYILLQNLLRAMPSDRRQRVLSEFSSAWRMPHARHDATAADADAECIMMLSMRLAQVLSMNRLLMSADGAGGLSTASSFAPTYEPGDFASHRAPRLSRADAAEPQRNASFTGGVGSYP